MASDVKPNLPIDEVFSIIAQATETWRKENTGEAVTKAVFDKLDKSRDEVILKLMGFDARWYNGRFELDHCNGRNGNSLIGKMFSEGVENQVRKWVNDNTDTLDFSKDITKMMINEARKEYKEAFRRALREAVYSRARKDAEKVIDELGKSQIMTVISEMQKTA